MKNDEGRYDRMDSKKPRIAVVTDSNSGISQSEASEKGIFILPMPFLIGEDSFFEDIDLSQDEFYDRLEEGRDIHTSQPSPESVMDLWNDILKKYDEIVHIPMSSGLSGSCQSAMMLAQEYEGKVQVVNNQRISVTQRQSVLDALLLVEKGLSAKEIKDILEEDKMNSSIYIMLDTLYYLKKGGRITPAAAALGTLLKLKPVLQIQGEKLDAFAKARGWKSAKKTMIQTIQKVIDTEFSDCKGPENLYIDAAYTGNQEDANEWKRELEETFPEYDIYMAPLSLSVAWHIGPGARAVTVTKRLKVS